MKIVDKLLDEYMRDTPYAKGGVHDVTATFAFKAGYQAAVDQLTTRDQDAMLIVASSKDFKDHLEREVEDE